MTRPHDDDLLRGNHRHLRAPRRIMTRLTLTTCSAAITVVVRLPARPGDS